MKLRILVLAIIMPAIGIPQMVRAESDPQQLWNAFRDLHPFHTQAIAASEPDSDGSRVLIISEPPPHISEGRLRQLLPGSVMFPKKRVGFDGWVKDAVAVLPRLSESQFAALIDQIHGDFFGTSYKASVLKLPSEPPAGKFEKSLNLAVGAYDLEAALMPPITERSDTANAVLGLTLLISFVLLIKFLRNPSSARIVRFFVAVAICGGIYWLTEPGVPNTTRFLVNGQPETASVILSSGISGVFESENPGLVLWTIGSRLSTQDRATIRMFALDSDLILGAVKASDRVGIVARERATTLDLLPPLRTETVLQLAAANTRELSQSYERNSLLAGRVHLRKEYCNRGECDWAPIYLSDALIDTEYGSLLNVTDQLLKSWSQHGEVRYFGFDYPQPPGYPFSKPLDQEVKSKQVTFNWNTKGVGYVVSGNAGSIYAINRTGALPVDYLGDSDVRLHEAEEKAYEYFATLGNPDLIRVVQYGALYQVFRRFGVTAKAEKLPDFPKATSLQQTSVRRAMEDLKSFTPGAKASAQRRIEAASGLPDDVRQYQLEMLNKLEPVARAVRQLERQNRAAYDQLVAVLSDPGELRRLESRNPAAESVEDTVDNLAREIEHLKHAIVDSEDQASGFETYSASKRRQSKVWVQTPSTVVSWGTTDAAIQGVGGHNLGAAVSEFKIDATLERGATRVVDEGGNRTVFVNPEDEASVKQMVRTVGRNNEKTPEQINEMLRDNLAKTVPAETRPLHELLNLPADFARNERGLSPEYMAKSTQRLGWWPSKTGITGAHDSLASALSSRKLPAILVEKTSTGHYLVINTSTRQVVEASTTPSAIEAVTRSVANVGDDVKLAGLHFQGMTFEEARGFRISAELQMGKQTKDRLIMTLNEEKVDPERLTSLLSSKYGLKKVAIEEIKPILNESAVEVRVSIAAVEKPPVTVRIKIALQKGAELTAELMSRLRGVLEQWIGRISSAPNDFEMLRTIHELQRDLEKIQPGLSIQIDVSDQATSLAIVELFPVLIDADSAEDAI